MKKAVFLGHNALGDTLCTTPVLRAFRRAHPDTFVVYVVQNASFCRVLDGNPDVDLVLYNEWMYLYGLTQFSQQWLATLPLDLQETALLYRFDIRQVCSRAEAFQEHISKGFARLLGIETDTVRPVVALGSQERQQAQSFVRRPYVVFSMHSVSNPARQDGNGNVKDWPLERWAALARWVHDSLGLDVMAVGAEKDAQQSLPLVRNLYGLPIKVVAALLEGAACVVTVESGLAHLAAAVDARTVVIYADVVPLGWANPVDSSCCRVLYGDPHSLDWPAVRDAVEATLAVRTGSASA